MKAGSRHLREEPEKEGTDKPRRLRNGKPISFESAIFIFALLNASADTTVIERALKLALRGPDLIRDALQTWLPEHGVNIDALMAEEPTTKASKAEVMELVEPFLKRGSEMAVFAQIADIYLFGKERTPENIVYAFYIGTRFAIAREREPSNDEKKRIWEIALFLAQTSNIGAPYWADLESKGPVYLKDWIDERKEDARKKYETFLRQKKKAERTAEEAFKSLLSVMFGEDEESA
jgi:hypothetical protein